MKSTRDDKKRVATRRALTRKGKLAKFDKYKREGFVLRLVNNVDGRVEDVEEYGYKKVTDADGKEVRRQVGAGIEGVLMEIPLDMYEDAQRVKEEENLEHDEAVGRNSHLTGGILQSRITKS